MSCADGCSCYYLQKEKANVLNCSNMSLASLENLRVPDETTWFIADSNNITNICSATNLMNITKIDLHSSGVITICDEYFEVLANHGIVYVLNLANNKITTIGSIITKLTSLETAYLAGNPIDCTCNTLWLTDWLVNFTTSLW